MKLSNRIEAFFIEQSRVDIQYVGFRQWFDENNCLEKIKELERNSSNCKEAEHDKASETD